MRQKRTKENIIKLLTDYRQKYNKIPTSREFQQKYRIYNKTIQANGGWNALLSETFGSINKFSRRDLIETFCGQCNKKINVKHCEKKVRNFCSGSCAAIYHNSHKTTGTNRSKFEIYIQKKLETNYPDLEVFYNDVSVISAELDIYIPCFSLAFELNGIFHYEPIFGEEKLGTTQNNDKRKMQACLENKIELCIIDISSLKYFKEERANKFWEIIKNLVDFKLAHSSTLFRTSDSLSEKNG